MDQYYVFHPKGVVVSKCSLSAGVSTDGKEMKTGLSDPLPISQPYIDLKIIMLLYYYKVGVSVRECLII